MNEQNQHTTGCKHWQLGLLNYFPSQSVQTSFCTSAGCLHGGFVPFVLWKPESRQNLNYCSGTSQATSSMLLLILLVLNLFSSDWAKVWRAQLSVGTLEPPDPWNRNGGKPINNTFNVLWFVHTCKNPRELQFFVSLFTIFNKEYKSPWK